MRHPAILHSVSYSGSWGQAALSVEQFIDTPVKRYSSGMFVRLGFAVAAHLDAEIMLVDEVLAVGDAAFQRNHRREKVARFMDPPFLPLGACGLRSNLLLSGAPLAPRRLQLVVGRD